MIREDPISRHLLEAMSALRTPFVRLVFLATMRDRYTGHYMHEGWAAVSSPEAVSSAMKLMHREVFEAVAVLPLLDLCKEIRLHFDSLSETEAQTASFWLETEPYYDMIPAGYPLLARKLFISQIRVALEILVRSPKWTLLETSISSPPLPLDLTHPPHSPN